jgi:hypothetical protein
MSSYQRVICRRLAVQPNRLGIPLDLASVMFKAWAGRNRPPHRQIITEEETASQTRDAYRKNHRSYGCKDPMIRAYCQPTCPVLQRRSSSVTPGTSSALPRMSNRQEPT